MPARDEVYFAEINRRDYDNLPVCTTMTQDYDQTSAIWHFTDKPEKGDNRDRGLCKPLNVLTDPTHVKATPAITPAKCRFYDWHQRNACTLGASDP